MFNRDEWHTDPLITTDEGKETAAWIVSIIASWGIVAGIVFLAGIDNLLGVVLVMLGGTAASYLVIRFITEPLLDRYLRK